MNNRPIIKWGLGDGLASVICCGIIMELVPTIDVVVVAYEECDPPPPPYGSIPILKPRNAVNKTEQEPKM